MGAQEYRSVSLVVVGLGFALTSCSTSPKAKSADASSDAPSGPVEVAGGPQEVARPDESPLGVDASIPPGSSSLTGICIDTGWCWQRPRPQGNVLYDLWAGAEDDVWAVGTGGTIIHWDGQTWTSRAVPSVHDDFYTVWGFGGEVWVGGEGSTYHFKDNAWKKESGTSRVTRIFGSSLENVWATVDSPGVFARRASQGWGEVKLPSTTDLCKGGWTSSPTDVWLSCEELMHYNGAGFTSMGFSAQAPVGKSAADLWAIGSASSVRHFDGQTWATVKAAGDPLSTDGLVGIWPRSPSEVWVVSGLGGVQRYDGVRWTTVTEAGAGTVGFLTGVGTTTMWMGGYSAYLQRGDGHTFTAMTETTDSSVVGLWAADADNAWAATDNGILRKTGGGWAPVSGTAGLAYAQVSGSGSTDVWFMQPGGALKHWDGTSLSDIPAPAAHLTPSLLITNAPGNVWEVEAKTAYRWDGTRWSNVAFRTSSDKAVSYGWSGGPSDLWIVTQGTLYHWDGSAVTSIAIDASAAGGWGIAADDLWGITGGDTVAHFDGQAWQFTRLTPPANVTLDLATLAGTSRNNVWALAAGGYAYHWDGKAWSGFFAYTFGDYDALAVTPDGGAFMAGSGDAILYHAPP